ncbi:unnamed protein product [Chrysoparadoxa australica]
MLGRAKLEDFWMLAAIEGAWDVKEHFILYPNPYPKDRQLNKRWHGHPAFPLILGLGGIVTVRTDWFQFVEEFARAVELLHHASQLHDLREVKHLQGWEGGDAAAAYTQSAAQGPQLLDDIGEGLTNFEEKYARSGRKLYELKLHPSKELEREL